MTRTLGAGARHLTGGRIGVLALALIFSSCGRSSTLPTTAAGDMGQDGAVAGARDSAPDVAQLTAPRWATRFVSPNNINGASLAVDSAGNLYISGNFAKTITCAGKTLSVPGWKGLFVVSLDASGRHRFSRSVPNAGQFGASSSIAVGPKGNIYLTGFFSSSADFGGGVLKSVGGEDVFLVSYSASGTHRFSKSFGGRLAEYARDIAMDGGGNIYLTGSLDSDVSFGGKQLLKKGYRDTFLASFTPKGQHRFSRAFSDGWSSHGQALAVDGKGNVHLAGATSKSIDFGGGDVAPVGTTHYGIFLASFTSQGKHRFSHAFGGASWAKAQSLAADSSGNIHLAGVTLGALDFGGGAISPASPHGTFLTSFNTSGVHRFSNLLHNWVNNDGSVGLAVDDTRGTIWAASLGPATATPGKSKPDPADRNDFVLIGTSSSGKRRFRNHFAGDRTEYWPTLTLGDKTLFFAGAADGEVDFGAGPVKPPPLGGHDLVITALALPTY